MIKGVIETIIRGISRLLKSMAEVLDRYQENHAVTAPPPEVEAGYQEIKPSQPQIRYKAVPQLFTSAEKTFLDVLESISGQEMRVFGKVRICDILTPDVSRVHNERDWQWLFDRIEHDAVDFMITDRELNVVCAVELNDPSHERPEAELRSRFIRKAFESAHIPLVIINTQDEYLEQHIADTIAIQVTRL